MSSLYAKGLTPWSLMTPSHGDCELGLVVLMGSLRDELSAFDLHSVVM